MSNEMSWYSLTPIKSINSSNLLNPSIKDKRTQVASSAPADSISSSPASHDNTTSSKSPMSSSCSIDTPMRRGLAYGDGFFTTMGVYEGHILWQSYHQNRLITHSQALHLYLPTKVQHSIWQQAEAFARHISHGILKIIISRQAQNLRGYAFSTQLEDNGVEVWLGVLPTVPLAEKKAEFLSAGLGDLNAKNALTDHQYANKSSQHILQQPSIVATCLESQLASLPPPLAGLKTLNRLDSVLIAGELEQRKLGHPELAEGLVKDMTGTWVEGVMSNVFYQLQENRTQWYTPPIASSGVCGIMREVIRDTFAATDRPVKERPLTDSDLNQLQAMFFCNAVRGVIPVKALQVSRQTIMLSLC